MHGLTGTFVALNGRVVIHMPALTTRTCFNNAISCIKTRFLQIFLKPAIISQTCLFFLVLQIIVAEIDREK